MIFLNLDALDKKYSIPQSIKHINILKPEKVIHIDNLDDIINKNYKNDVIFQIKHNRFPIIYLYDCEIQKKIKSGVTKNILDKLKNIYFAKHIKQKKIKKIVNVYIRRGDLHQIGNKQNRYDNNFEFSIFKYTYKKLEKTNNYIFNIISAGNINEMNEIKKKYSIFNNLNFHINKEQDIVFDLMVNSDILIFNYSTFPFTAGLYCDGIIIKKKYDGYSSSNFFGRDISFLDNWIFIENDNKNINEINKKII
jgi:hypothetical protein